MPEDDPEFAFPSPSRRIFCNRTLNLRSVKAVGFDMDYTLVHYRAEEWERRAYQHARQSLLERGWPVAELEFDENFVTLGLILDLSLGNIVKSNRFGYVTRAYHGTRPLEFEAQRNAYSRVLVDLENPRWVFLNTLFGLSEATLYAQAVDLLEAGRLEPAIGYADLHAIVRSSLDAAHLEGRLKAEIMANPERFVVLDEELPVALMDLRQAGKKLLVITNSEWSYTRSMMSYAFDRYLPKGSSWRTLFDVVIVEARKPSFFTGRNPAFEVVSEEGLLRPHIGKLAAGGLYLGGHARLIEQDLELLPEEILFVGDHVYADVHVTKHIMRWRTALVLRDLEGELAAIERFRPQQAKLTQLMAEKERLEHEFSSLRLHLQRADGGIVAGTARTKDGRRRMQQLREQLSALDAQIAPLARDAGEQHSRRWGLLMRAGADKSYLARQIERYADIYTSRVSNFGAYTPFVYLRAPRVSLPHDGTESTAGDHLTP
jgi:5'-nucleotidase